PRRTPRARPRTAAARARRRARGRRRARREPAGHPGAAARRRAHPERRMSAATATARPLRGPAHEPVRRLEVVTTRAQRAARPRLLPAVITVAGIVGILLGQLLLSIVLADGAYTIAGLQAEQRDLLRDQEALSEQLE